MLDRLQRNLVDARHNMAAAQLGLRVARRSRYHSDADLRVLEARFCAALDRVWEAQCMAEGVFQGGSHA